MSSVADGTHDMQPESASGRLPARLSCSATRLPDSLVGLGSVQSGPPVLAAPQQEDRFEFPCDFHSADCVNGFVTPDNDLCVEIYRDDGKGDFRSEDVLLTRANALALAAWINHAYGVTP